jgi:hypothetical protein
MRGDNPGGRVREHPSSCNLLDHFERGVFAVGVTVTAIPFLLAADGVTLLIPAKVYEILH